MNSTELATLSMPELKSFCTANSIEVIGDKRFKSTYIPAIETFQSEQTVIEIIEMPAIPNPFELPLVEDVTACSHSPMADSIVKRAGYANEIPVPQPTAPTPQRGASLVILVIATMLWALSIVTVTGLRSITLLIAAVWRLSLALHRSIKVPAIDTRSIPIEYFPT
jgi:hypothetical protein